MRRFVRYHAAHEDSPSQVMLPTILVGRARRASESLAVSLVCERAKFTRLRHVGLAGSPTSSESASELTARFRGPL
jgi:hypothetical protein